jgi:hypothetical protein
MSENATVRVTEARAVGNNTLRLTWQNGGTTQVDLTEPINRLKGLRALRDPGFFSCVAVGEGGHSVVWGGDRDMGAARLWEMSLEQNGRGDAAEFIRWRWRHGLSLSEAAEALGLSRRQVAYYVSGDEPARAVVMPMRPLPMMRVFTDPS